MRREVVSHDLAPVDFGPRAEAVLATIPEDWDEVVTTFLVEDGSVRPYTGPAWWFVRGAKYVAVAAPFESMEQMERRETYLSKVRYALDLAGVSA